MSGGVDSQTKYTVGTCDAMCPRREMILREKENLLHKFEMKAGTENNKLPKVDPDKAVKCYGRSAAGRENINSSDLRPFHVLMKTITYLYHDIFPLHKENPLTVYNFMFDRFRSVRQDMVIQNLPPSQVICVLEPISRFHMYFGYYLTEENSSNFDPYINRTHLEECLKRLLVCYDECGLDCADLSEATGSSVANINSKTRCDMESAHLLLNLTHHEALARGVKLCDIYLRSESVKLSFAWYLKNYVRVFDALKNLPPLLLCVASTHIPEFRKRSLMALSHAFSCSNSFYPVSHLKCLLMYESDSEVICDCSHFNIKITDENVQFSKKDFDLMAELKESKRMRWIDEKLLQCDLVKLLCYGIE